MAPSGKLCSGTFSTSPVEAHIFRLGGGGGGRNIAAPAPEPPRSIFVGAGFFTAHASFLQVAPFDPFLPFVWAKKSCSRRGSIRTALMCTRLESTSSLINTDLGRLGLPKFWESQDRAFGSGGSNTRFMLMIVDRVKHMVGYDMQVKNPDVLNHVNDHDGPNYGGSHRSLQFLAFAGLDMVAMTARSPAGALGTTPA